MVTTAPNGAREEIPVTISKPEGPGPFPVVVIMHDCSGLGPRSSGAPERWARELGARGYVTVIPDSFTTRGHADGVCTDASPSRGEVSPSRRVRDAYAALAHARALPYVDGRHVGLMGGSHGGSTTLASMAAPQNTWDLLAREKQRGLRRGGGPLSGLRDRARHLARRRHRHLPIGRAAADPDRGKR